MSVPNGIGRVKRRLEVFREIEPAMGHLRAQQPAQRETLADEVSQLQKKATAIGPDVQNFFLDAIGIAALQVGVRNPSVESLSDGHT